MSDDQRDRLSGEAPARGGAQPAQGKGSKLACYCQQGRRLSVEGKEKWLLCVEHGLGISGDEVGSVGF